MFATTDEVAARIGRDLSATETTQTETLLELATGLIADACGRDEAWAAALDPVPPTVRVVCIEATVRVLLNPRGVRSQQEALGAFSHAESFTDSPGAAGLTLTPTEQRMVRRAVYGSSTGSAPLGSMLDDAGLCVAGIGS